MAALTIQTFDFGGLQDALIGIVLTLTIISLGIAFLGNRFRPPTRRGM